MEAGQSCPRFNGFMTKKMNINRLRKIKKELISNKKTKKIMKMSFQQFLLIFLNICFSKLAIEVDN